MKLLWSYQPALFAYFITNKAIFQLSSVIILMKLAFHDNVYVIRYEYKNFYDFEKKSKSVLKVYSPLHEISDYNDPYGFSMNFPNKLKGFILFPKFLDPQN